MLDEKELMWKEKERRELYKTAVFTVTERTSLSPEGTEGKYIVNEAPDWVIVVPVDGEDFLMVKQWRHGEKALSVEFPGGVIDSGEDPLTAAKRELLEETGCTAGKMTKLGKFNPNPALFANHTHVFLAEELSYSGKQDLDSDEYVHYLKLSKKEVMEGMGTDLYSHGLMTGALGLYLCRK